MALNGGPRRRRWRPALSGGGSAGDIAIDLGTANTVVYVRGVGIVLSEPSVVAIDEVAGEVYAVGTEAERMIGRTPAAISATRPLRHGVIADFDVTEQMLRQFIAKVVRSRWARPRLVMCAPSGITEVERRAIEEASLSAGAREVHLIEESRAAAIGAGLPIAEPIGRMVVDVGGGTSEVALISLGEIVASRSARVGGYDLDEAIGAHLRTAHRMTIGSNSAEAIKLAVGSAAPRRRDRGGGPRPRPPVRAAARAPSRKRRGPPGDRRPALEIMAAHPRDARGDAAAARRDIVTPRDPACGRRVAPEGFAERVRPTPACPSAWPSRR